MDRKRIAYPDRKPVEQGPGVLVDEVLVAGNPIAKRNLDVRFVHVSGKRMRFRAPVRDEFCAKQSYARIEKPARDVLVRWEEAGSIVPKPEEGKGYRNSELVPHFGIAPDGQIWQFLDIGWASPITRGDGRWRATRGVVVVENLSKHKRPTGAMVAALDRILLVLKRIYGTQRVHRDPGWER